ncbi:hypothetical protein SAMN04490197_1594 [Pseudomonas orientalis]|uniref:Type III secretion effector protein n=2 Tax=Pseudomonas orientalis TaxID=76758 RepID=A0A8B3XV43_9PSED|nr:hypothetical protein SAMN04490197_1594 [Pseudomonas orientalis]
MLVSNVNYAVSGYAEASSGLSASGLSNEIMPASPAEQLNSLVGELERLLGLLSSRFEAKSKVSPSPAPAVNNLPYNREVTPGEFIRGTAANTGVKPDDIFKDFYQMTEGNCVTISAIKAAMMKFGHNPHGIYKSIHATDAGYHIVMRDGCKLDITHDELEEAKAGADFGADRPNDVLVNAQFLYAVSAKRAYHENNDGIGKQSFAAAMRSLNDGEYPGQALRRLGLKDFVAPASLEDFLSGAIGTVDNGVHSMAVVDGFLDVYGFKQPMRDRGWSSHRAIGLKLL